MEENTVKIPTATETVDALLTQYGITYTAQFVPQSLSRHSAEKTRTLNWRVTLTNKDKQSMAIDYMQGVGHIPQSSTKLSPSERSANEWAASEEGRYQVSRTSWMMKKLLIPAAADICHCLVMDDPQSECFEDWAATFGYDVDSRKAEETYHACVKQTRDARRVLGAKLLAELAEALQDY